MKQAPLRLLVLDADIFLGASERGDKRAALFHRVLEAIIESKLLGLVLNEKLYGEYFPSHRGNARYGRKLYNDLNTRRKIVWADRPGAKYALDRDHVARAETIDAKALGKCDLTQTQREELKNDLHLLQLALQGDRQLLTNNRSEFNLYKRLAEHCTRTATIELNNPMREEDAVLKWLRSGAPSRPAHRILTYSG